MSDATERRPAQTAESRRSADHAAIDRLATELLPALVAKLAGTGLGEIEVREGGWKVRLRRPADAGSGSRMRRSTDRPSRPQPGHEGHGHPPGAFEGHRSARSGAAEHSANGSGPGEPSRTGVRAAAAGEGRSSGDPHRAVATSPAVGVFQPRPDARPGSRVRAGDRLGVVDMLGVPQEVVAPADGIVMGVLADAGDGVEYGQDLVAIELMTQAAGGFAAGGG